MQYFLNWWPLMHIPLDLSFLSRCQFAFTIGFHIIWPTLTIGLGLFLLILESLWLKTKDPAYKQLYLFWVKVFALGFGMGIVTGIPLSYQFGTNFSGLSEAAGSVLGPLLSVEVMTAFFLEAAFIGVMLFGWDRVPPGCTISLPALSYSVPIILPFGSSLLTPGCIRLRAQK